MIFALKSTLSLNNIKILRPKVTKNLTNSPKKFCESPPGQVGNCFVKAQKNISYFEIDAFGFDSLKLWHMSNLTTQTYDLDLHFSLNNQL